jgi:hypothetical protein
MSPRYFISVIVFRALTCAVAAADATPALVFPDAPGLSWSVLASASAARELGWSASDDALLPGRGPDALSWGSAGPLSLLPWDVRLPVDSGMGDAVRESVRLSAPRRLPDSFQVLLSGLMTAGAWQVLRGARFPQRSTGGFGRWVAGASEIDGLEVPPCPHFAAGVVNVLATRELPIEAPSPYCTHRAAGASVVRPPRERLPSVGRTRAPPPRRSTG